MEVFGLPDDLPAWRRLGERRCGSCSGWPGTARGRSVRIHPPAGRRLTRPHRGGALPGEPRRRPSALSGAAAVGRAPGRPAQRRRTLGIAGHAPGGGTAVRGRHRTSGRPGAAGDPDPRVGLNQTSVSGRTTAWPSPGRPAGHARGTPRVHRSARRWSIAPSRSGRPPRAVNARARAWRWPGRPHRWRVQPDLPVAAERLPGSVKLIGSHQALNSSRKWSSLIGRPMGSSSGIASPFRNTIRLRAKPEFQSPSSIWCRPAGTTRCPPARSCHRARRRRRRTAVDGTPGACLRSCDDRRRELEQTLLVGVEIPVHPGNLVVLGVDVVVAALGAAELVAVGEHRHPWLTSAW